MSCDQTGGAIDNSVFVCAMFGMQENKEEEKATSGIWIPLIYSNCKLQAEIEIY